MTYDQQFLDWALGQYGGIGGYIQGDQLIRPPEDTMDGAMTYNPVSLSSIYNSPQWQNQSGFDQYMSQIQQNAIQNFNPANVVRGDNYQSQYFNPTSGQMENLFKYQSEQGINPESGENTNPAYWLYESQVPQSDGFNPLIGNPAQAQTWSDDQDIFESVVNNIGDLALGSAGFGVGATTGAAGATGNINSTEDLMNYLQTDLAGLQAAGPLAAGTQALSNAGIGGVLTGAQPAGSAAAGGTSGAVGAVPSPVGDPGAGITQTPIDGGFTGMEGAQNLDLSGLNLDALNQGLEGLGTSVGGIGSTLQNLFNQFTQQQQGQQQNQQNNQWVNAGMGLLQYQAMKEYQDKLMQTMNRAIDYSDPFHSQRPQYQQQFNQLTQNPSAFFEDPAIKNIIEQQQNASQARLASQGYNMSGNMAHEVNQTGMNAAFNQYMPYSRMIGEAGGAFQGPGQAGNIAANMGGAAAGAGLGALGALGSSVGSIFGQTPQTGGGTNTGNSVGGSILNDVLKAGGQIFNGIQGLFS